jgi:hypothetical protein
LELECHDELELEKLAEGQFQAQEVGYSWLFVHFLVNIEMEAYTHLSVSYICYL